jgi:hypothetical protein
MARNLGEIASNLDLPGDAIARNIEFKRPTADLTLTTSYGSWTASAFTVDVTGTFMVFGAVHLSYADSDVTNKLNARLYGRIRRQPSGGGESVLGGEMSLNAPLAQDTNLTCTAFWTGELTSGDVLSLQAYATNESFTAIASSRAVAVADWSGLLIVEMAS